MGESLVSQQPRPQVSSNVIMVRSAGELSPKARHRKRLPACEQRRTPRRLIEPDYDTG
jgi:hypothetical protein